MLTTSLICAVILLLWLAKLWLRPTKPRGDMDKIPGPTASPWGKLLRPNTREHVYPQRAITEAAKKYGPIFKVRQLNGDDLVFVGNYQLIHEVLVSSGKEFGGRSKLFRLQAGFDNSGILQNTEPDDKWKLLRKISQRHLRQFGDGLNRLEQAITEIADDMFDTFEENEGRPFDPKSTCFNLTLSTMLYLISGQRCNVDGRLGKFMKEYYKGVISVIPAVTPLSFELMDAVPWLRHMGLPCWKLIKNMRKVESKAWDEVVKINKSDPEIRSICKVYLEYMNSADDSEMTVTEREARVATLLLLIGGTLTTSSTFHAAINILAHHPDKQERIAQDIEKVVGSTRHVTLDDRPSLPYMRATIFEILRYHSVSPLGATHRCCKDTTLGGFLIPKDTRVAAALYLLHHDEDFWGDPYVFRPERFLDEHGDLLPADHPKRKHLLPFGAGTRVCVGETLALLRLFVWLSNIIQKYEIRPAPGNEKSSADSRNFRFDGILFAPDYEVILTLRQ